MHHAHHRGDDAERGHRVAELGDAVHRNLAFLVVGLDLVVHQVLDLERVQVAAHHQAQVVGEELEHVVVGERSRGYLANSGLCVGLLDVVFDRHQAFLAHLGQDVVEQRHQLHVHGLGVLRSPSASIGSAFSVALIAFDGVADEERAGGGAADHQQLDRLEQRGEVAAGQRKAAEHRDAER